MKRTITAADQAIRPVRRQQGDLVTRAQVLAAGMTTAALRHRLGSGGSWTVVLPGIYLTNSGLLTAGQREIAAVLYVGRGCVITGAAALRRQGVRVPPTETIDVLIPDTVRRRSSGFVEVHRTSRMPDHPYLLDGLEWAPVARAIADAARGRIDVRAVRDFVADAVQRRRCTVQQLIAELAAGPSQGSSALRAVLEEAADGVASVAEGDLRDLIRRGGLPAPMYNPSLYIGPDFLAKPDAWWPDAGVACEVDSREWHLSPADWERTMARHAKMSAHGIIVLHFTPRRLHSEPKSVISQLTSALDVGKQRPPLPIRAVPSADR